MAVVRNIWSIYAILLHNKLSQNLVALEFGNALIGSGALLRLQLDVSMGSSHLSQDLNPHLSHPRVHSPLHCWLSACFVPPNELSHTESENCMWRDIFQLR